MTERECRKTLALVRVTQCMDAVLKPKAVNDKMIVTISIDEDLGK